MDFIKTFLQNLVVLIVIGIGLFFAFPDIMGHVFEFYDMLLGPLAIVILIVAALPRKKTRRGGARKPASEVLQGLNTIASNY